jgi:uncharacterized protein YifN (PemK superfamily)
MSLFHQPKEGTIVICDFFGFREPEMIKKRPVVVLRKHRSNPKLVTIVPLSTTRPDVTMSYHHEFLSNPLPDGMPFEITWAKCDMVVTVSLDRLDRVKVKSHGKRIYIEPTISAADLVNIRQCVVDALGLGPAMAAVDEKKALDMKLSEELF